MAPKKKNSIKNRKVGATRTELANAELTQNIILAIKMCENSILYTTNTSNTGLYLDSSILRWLKMANAQWFNPKTCSFDIFSSNVWRTNDGIQHKLFIMALFICESSEHASEAIFANDRRLSAESLRWKMMNAFFFVWRHFVFFYSPLTCFGANIVLFTWILNGLTQPTDELSNYTVLWQR